MTIHALTFTPGTAGSARVEELDAPAGSGAVLATGLALGVCGTDLELLAGDYGWPAPGSDRLVLGHVGLGRVQEAPAGSGLAPGDLVVGMVRHPDPGPCGCCATGRADLCRTGEYTERGIKELDGFGASAWRVDPERAIRVDAALGLPGVLVEPTSVVAKAWDRVDQAWTACGTEASRVLVTGAGPVGLLAALLGVQRGLEVHVLDREDAGPKPDLVRALGATFHTGRATDTGGPFDVVVEATGVGAVIVDALGVLAADGVLCLTGLSPRGRTLQVDMGGAGTDLVLGNRQVVGSVSASRAHYETAAAALASADPEWLERMITRRIPLSDAGAAASLERRPEDVKAVIDLGS
jgi:threonine dehydrogenase-like Zn-dependent dehydrogenase